MEYGLIGTKLGHSYSKIIHEQLYGGPYELHALPTEAEARAFFAAKDFKAVNVTIPYKRLVMEYCDEIEPMAAEIGAVNTVVNRGGRLYGCNTDAAGFAYLARAHGIDFAGRTVLILGTGGTHNTVRHVVTAARAAQVLTASRRPDAAKGELSYAEAAACGAQIVVNTTPAGMYPDVGVCPLDVAAMPRLEAVLDVVYNPFRTELLLRAEEAGAKAACGFEMLVAQAVFAAEYFLGRKFPEGEIERVHGALKSRLVNVSLIGMPSCGKTSIGKALSKRLGEAFGQITPERMIEIIKRPVAMRSNLHNAIFMPETRDMWFSDAGRKTPACDEPYVKVNLIRLLEIYAADKQANSSTASRRMIMPTCQPEG